MMGHAFRLTLGATLTRVVASRSKVDNYSPLPAIGHNERSIQPATENINRKATAASDRPNSQLLPAEPVWRHATGRMESVSPGRSSDWKPHLRRLCDGSENSHELAGKLVADPSVSKDTLPGDSRRPSCTGRSPRDGTRVLDKYALGSFRWIRDCRTRGVRYWTWSVAPELDRLGCSQVPGHVWKRNTRGPGLFSAILHYPQGHESAIW